MVEQTSFEEPNARAEVNRYTYTPDLPAVLPARQGPAAPAARRRAAPPRHRRSRPAARSTTRCCDNGIAADQLPPAAAARDDRRLGRRRTAAAVRARPRARRRPDPLRAGHPGDRPRGRALASRLLARRVEPASGAPDGPAGADRGAVRRARARGSSTSSTSTARGRGSPAQPRRGRRDRRARRRADPARRRPRGRRPDPARVRGRGDAGRPRDERRRRPGAPRRLPRGRRRLAGRRARPATGPARRVPLASGPRRPRSTALVDELVERGVRRFVLSHGGAEPDARARWRLARATRRRGPRRRRHATTSTGSAGCATRASAGIILGEALLSGAIDFPAALEAAA